MIANALAIAWKELQVLLKDRGSLAVLFLLPLVLASVFGSISSAATGAIEGEETIAHPIYVLNLDSGPYGEQVVSTLEDIGVLDITHLDSDAPVDQLVADEEQIAAVVIPEAFSRQVDAYEPSVIQVIVDPTQEEYSSIVTGMMNDVVMPIALVGEIQHGIRTVLERSGEFADVDVQTRRGMEAQTLGVIMTQLQKLREEPWIEVKHEGLEGVEAEGPWNPFSYNIPAFTVMFGFFLVGTVAQSIWQEKESGAFRRLLSAPLHRGSIIAGKVLAYMLIVCLQVLIFFTVGSAVFDMPLGDAPLALILLSLALAFTATSLGILLATLTRSSRQADSAGMVLGFVLAAVGGCLAYPLFMVEGVIGLISRLSPHAHAMEAFMDVMIGGATLVDVLPQIGILTGFGLAFFLFGVWRFKFE
ncbi:MAG: ABC transporter permease [Chloroflexia bacterium]|nr:ABC transporter permease [Chloroflexia bacterium]